jgi:hypothetical protein
LGLYCLISGKRALGLYCLISSRQALGLYCLISGKRALGLYCLISGKRALGLAEMMGLCESYMCEEVGSMNYAPITSSRDFWKSKHVMFIGAGLDFLAGYLHESGC